MHTQLHAILESIRHEADIARNMLNLSLAKAHAVTITNLAEEAIALIIAETKEPADEDAT